MKDRETKQRPNIFTVFHKITVRDESEQILRTHSLTEIWLNDIKSI